MDIKAVFMGIAFAAMWSSAFTSARIIVQDAPPLTALALRFALSGILGILIAFAAGQRARLTRQQWLGVLVFGLCQNALYLGLNFMAMQRVEASFAAIIASALPLAVAAVGWLVFRRKVRPLGAAGLVAGMAGVLLIMGARLSGGTDPGGTLMLLAGLAAITVATLVVMGATSGGNVLMIVGLQLLVGAVLVGVPAVLTEPFVVDWSWRLVIAFLYTTLVPGLLATWVWFTLVRRIGAVKASTFHFLNPFLGVLIAALFLGEAIGPADILGVIIIAGGILAVQLSKQA